MSIYSGNEEVIFYYFHIQALQQRRTQLDNMLIVPPQHMELVDSYIHCGWVADPGILDGNTYDKPWQWLIQNQGMHRAVRWTIESYRHS